MYIENDYRQWHEQAEKEIYNFSEYTQIEKLRLFLYEYGRQHRAFYSFCNYTPLTRGLKKKTPLIEKRSFKKLLKQGAIVEYFDNLVIVRL